MSRLFAYIITSGVHGGVYKISKTDLTLFDSLKVGDVFKIKGLGMLQIDTITEGDSYTQGVKELYVYYNTKEVEESKIRSKEW